jgi:hypothetical protein
MMQRAREVPKTTSRMDLGIKEAVKKVSFYNKQFLD